MKKTIFLSAIILFAAIQATYGDSTKIGRMYEYIYSPGMSINSTDKQSAFNWMKENFDEHNIMLVSASRFGMGPSGLNNEGKIGGVVYTLPVLGDINGNNKTFKIDSLMVNTPVTSEVRASYWRWALTSTFLFVPNPAYPIATQENGMVGTTQYGVYDLPLCGSFSYPNTLFVVDDNAGHQNLGINAIYYAATSSSNAAAKFADIKEINTSIDDAVTQNFGLQNVPAIPITLKTEFKNGGISGTMSFKKNSMWAEQIPALAERQTVAYQIILCEAYHKFGTEEYYFFPRAYHFKGVSYAGQEVYLTNNTVSQNFDFEIDPSWNYKYLYVVALVEDALTHCVYDAVVDKVPNVKSVTGKAEIKLDITHAVEANKCLKIPAGGKAQSIAYRVNNPTGNEVKALVYINSYTSVLNNYTVTLNRDTITVPAGSSSNIIATITPPAAKQGCAFEIGLLPVGEADNQLPVISTCKTVVADEEMRVVALSDDPDMFQISNALFSNSYSENLMLIPDKYCSVIDPNLFDGFIYSATNNANVGYYWITVQIDGETRHFPEQLFGNYGYIKFTEESRNPFYELPADESGLMSRYLKNEDLIFLNNAIDAGKHIALFVDKSGWYSQYTGNNEKSAYTKLFTNLGVSYKSDTTIASESSTPFYVRGMTTDSLGTYKIKNADSQIVFRLNDYPVSNAVSSLSATSWNITNPAISKKVFYYGNDASSNAMVKTTKGTQKFLIAGNGFGGMSLETLNSLGYLLDNVTGWWFGYKPKPRPIISCEKTEFQMGQVNVGAANEAVTADVVIENLGAADEGYLKLFSIKFSNDLDGSFSIVNSIEGDSIAPGASKTFQVVFLPQNAMTYSNITLVISSNDPNNPALSLYFNGRGISSSDVKGPHIEVAPGDDFHNFTDTGAVVINSPRKPWDMVVTNGGNQTLKITSIELSPETDPSVFSIRLLDSANFWELGPFVDGEIRVYFTPSKIGTHEGAFIIKSNDTANPEFRVEFVGEVKDTLGIKEEIAKVFNCEITPNPATDVANINFNILGDLAQHITLNLMDNVGGKVMTISSETFAPGNYSKQISLKSLPAGVYYIQYIVNGMQASAPLTIVK